MLDIIYGHSDLWMGAQILDDALHGLARVVPVEATEEMIDGELDRRDRLTYGIGLDERSVSNAWRAMTAAGDLTNPPEEKP